MIHGIINNRGEFLPVGKSLSGAKRFASRNGFTVVAESSPLGYNIDILARKVQGEWI